MSSKTLCFELFYDIVSPYSYLAYKILSRYKDKWNTNLILRPVFLGGIFKGSGNSAPGTNPMKMKHMLQDLSRSQNYMNIPLNFPSRFPQNSVTAMRILTYLAHNNNLSKLDELTNEFYASFWSEGNDIDKLETIEEACKKVSMRDSKNAETWIQAAQSQTYKDLLKTNTDDAIKRGVFGAPTILISRGEMPSLTNAELFFGSDRFDQIAFLYGLSYEGPYPKHSHL